MGSRRAHAQPFELPEFYVGWPARLNPHVDAARGPHQGVGARGRHPRHPGRRTATPEIWDEAALDAMDYGLLCAYTHPDTLAARARPHHRLVRVGLLLRRPLPRRLQAHARPGRRARPPRAPAAVHAAGPRRAARPSRPTRSSAGCSTCGFARCRARRRSGASGSSRARENLLLESNWELNNINDERVANPIEYIAMRRKVGGAPWSAHLVEHANFVEVPDRIWDSRPLRVLQGHVRRRRPPAQRPVLLRARDRRRGRARQLRPRARALLRHRHPERGRPDQRDPHVAPAPVRAHRAHRGADPLRGERRSRRPSA